MKLKSARGFTLIEILIVLAIIGILATMASSTFYHYRQNINLREAAGAIMSDMKLAKQRAVAENNRYALKFNLITYSTVYQMGKIDLANNLIDPITKNLNDYGSGISFDDISDQFYFFQPRGTSTNGHIILQNSTKKIKITITTMGKVRSEDIN